MGRKWREVERNGKEKGKGGQARKLDWKLEDEIPARLMSANRG